MGRKKLPFYRIVAVDSRVRRDGAPLEVRRAAQAVVGRGPWRFPRLAPGSRGRRSKPAEEELGSPRCFLQALTCPAALCSLSPPAPQYLGWYDPLKKEANLNAPAIKKWLAVGAQPSDTVGVLLKKAMVMDA